MRSAHNLLARGLRALGTGADSYQLEVDRERGALLAATAIRHKQPFYKITALAIAFDEPIPPETFQFRPPEGEQPSHPEDFSRVRRSFPSPRRNGAPHSPFSCQIAFPPDGGHIAPLLKPARGHQYRSVSC